MLSPSETGTTLGATPGTCQEPGDRLLARVLGTGGARGASKARQLAALGVARPGRALHLIHGGPCLILPGPDVFFQDRHAGNCRDTSRDDPGHGWGTGEVGSPRRPRPEAVGAQAAVISTRTQGGGEHPGPGPGPDLIRVGPGASRKARSLCHHKHRRADRQLPAQQADCLPAGCAQRCG